MYNIKKLSNKLKISHYYSILQKNKLFFICISRKDSNTSEFVKKAGLITKGFNFKYIDNKKLKSFRFLKNVQSGLNGKIFFIYKEDFEFDDLSSLKFILKNFPILFFSYNKKFYSKKKIADLSNKVSDLDMKTIFSNLSGNISLNFFYKFYLQMETYKKIFES